MSKLKSTHVLIIGIVVCIIVGAGTYFLGIAGLEARKATAEQVIATRPQVEARLAAAKQMNQVLRIKLERYMRAKMPPISFQDRAEGMIALWKEQSENLGPIVNAWPAHTGVRMGQTIQIPAPPIDPNAIDTSMIKIPLGSLAVGGDFTTLMQHVRSWNKFNRLVQIDVKGLTGTSPFMTLTYEATVYIFPRGETGATSSMASATAPTPGT